MTNRKALNRMIIIHDDKATDEQIDKLCDLLDGYGVQNALTCPTEHVLAEDDAAYIVLNYHDEDEARVEGAIMLVLGKFPKWHTNH